MIEPTTRTRDRAARASRSASTYRNQAATDPALPSGEIVVGGGALETLARASSRS